MKSYAATTGSHSDSDMLRMPPKNSAAYSWFDMRNSYAPLPRSFGRFASPVRTEEIR